MKRFAMLLALTLTAAAPAQNGKPYGQEVEDAIRVLRQYDDEHGEFRYCELLRRASIPLHGTGCFHYGGTMTSIATGAIDAAQLSSPDE